MTTTRRPGQHRPAPKTGPAEPGLKVVGAPTPASAPRTAGPTDTPRFRGPLSHSGIERFAECPLQFKLERLDRIPAPASEPQENGKLAHEVIAVYLGHLVKTGQASDLAKLDEIVEQHVTRVPPSMNPGFLRDTIARFAQGFMLEQGEDEEVLLEQKMAVDRQFNPVAFDDPNAFFRGIADLTYLNRKARRARAIDFKTGYSMAHNDEQVARYGVLASRVFGVEQVEVGFYFVRHCRSTAVETLTLDDLRAAAKRIVWSYERIALEQKWKATPGPQCSNCPYAGTVHCAANLSAVEPIKSAEDAQRVVGELERLDGAVKRLKALCSTWASANGPIQMGKIEWGHHPRDSQKVSVPVLAALVEKSENEGDRAELLDILSVRTTRAAKRFVDRYAEDLEAHNGLARESKTTFSRVRLDSKNGENDE